MKRSVKVMLALTAVLAASVHAQEARVRVAPRGFGGELRAATVYAGPMARMNSVERILRLKEELKLTDAQVSQLESIRKELVAKRQDEARARIDLESRIAAGLTERRETRDDIEERVKKLRDEAEKNRERIEKILTEEQRDKLRDERIERARTLIRPRSFAPRGEARMMPGGRMRQIAPRGFVQPGGRFYFEPRGVRPGEMRVLPRYRWRGDI